MPLTDYIQVALQSRISLLQLNEFKLQYQYLARWKQALVNRLLLKDLATFQKLLEGPPSAASLAPAYPEAEAQGAEPLEDKADASILRTLHEVGEREQAGDV